MDRPFELLPAPRSLRRGEGGFDLGRTPTVGGGEEAFRARERLVRELARAGLEPRRVAPGARADVALAVDSRAAPSQGYRLEVTTDGVTLRGGDAAGAFHGACTLVQLVRGARDPDGVPRRLPALRIEDRPDLPVRGVLLDVSRGRVPRMDALLALVDRLAGWKLNQLQLYTEHTFAYRGHERVWRDADPFTPAEIRRLDRHCAERFVELVPNQQSFGHLHRWLVHPPYRTLAECPDGVEHPFSTAREPYGLCPGDPGSTALLADLYDQLLPCFSSRSFHVGLDEPIDLGRGRSRDACERGGTGRVYLDFVLRVHGLVRERGRRMHVWADALLEHPDLLGELPDDVVPYLWGYEAGHPFEAGLAALREHGLDVVVAPGTSSWQSLAGRTANVLANVAEAAGAAVASGAAGLVATDWGDRGHLQPPPVSLPGWLLAADYGWRAPGRERPRLDEAGLAARLDLFAFEDRAARLGEAALALGGAGEASGARALNASPLFLLLLDLAGPWPHPRVDGLTAQGLRRAEERIAAAREGIAASAPEVEDGELLRRELHWAADALALSAGLARERLEHGPALATLPGRVEHAARCEALLDGLAEIWEPRSRPGGLVEAIGWLRPTCDALAGGN